MADAAAGQPQGVPDLEAVSAWDGSWYDVDVPRSQAVVVDDAGRLGIQLVFK